MTTPSGTSSLGFQCAIASCRFGSNFCPPRRSAGQSVLGEEIRAAVSRPGSFRINRRVVDAFARRRRKGRLQKLSTIANEPLRRVRLVCLSVFFLAAPRFLIFHALEYLRFMKARSRNPVRSALQTAKPDHQRRFHGLGEIVFRLDTDRGGSAFFAKKVPGFFMFTDGVNSEVDMSFCGCEPINADAPSINRVMMARKLRRKRSAAMDHRSAPDSNPLLHPALMPSIMTPRTIITTTQMAQSIDL